MKWRELNQNPGQRVAEMKDSDPYTLFKVERGPILRRSNAPTAAW